MNKRAVAALILALSLSTTTVYADYVDDSNREHADQSNDIVYSAFIPKGNTIVIYLDNETGMDYDLASDKDNFSIPFVKVLSVKAEKRMLDNKHKNEVDSDYYNKITLTATSNLHERQRFVIINEFKDGLGEDSEENLLHSIAPRGEMKAPKYKPSDENSASDEAASDKKDDEKASQTEKKDSTKSKNTNASSITYDAIASCIAPDSTHVRLDFASDVVLDKEKAEDHRLYHMETASGVKLYALKAVVLGKNQILLETQPQTSNERVALTVDWIEAGDAHEGYFFSNAVSDTDTQAEISAEPEVETTTEVQ